MEERDRRKKKTEIHGADKEIKWERGKGEGKEVNKKSRGMVEVIKRGEKKQVKG